MSSKLTHIALTLVALLTTATMSAQTSLVASTPTSHVGEILFQTPKTVTFELQNKGSQATQITDVKPMCGCTQATWSRGLIQPGAKAKVSVVYDAKLLGTFRKEVAVYTTQSTEPLYLTMEGRVVTDKLDYSENYPIDLGSVALNTNYVEFDDVNRGDHPTAELQVYNKERTPYRPELMHLPNYLTMQCVPEVIAGGRTGRILLTLNSEKLGLLGLNQTRIFLSRYMGDKVGEQNEILVSAVLLPDFSKLTPAQLAVAPKLSLSQNELDFGSLNGKSKMTQAITLTNTGKSTLNIRTVQVFNQSLSVSLGDRSIEAGKSTQLKVTINSKYLKNAKNRPRVLLITNDPEESKRIINVTVKP